ncbi:MAG: PfkB family carbohydrate kinase [Terracidiphilus sp.]|nr:PfkB family carbohydrate kinase [Terracidiphilus sp.]MDR3798245.1 PfkB family carbohydrate kinase [Terracidiphilus sp.]
MPSVLFVGLSTVDVVYDVDEFPATNTKVAARSQSVFAGGPATNAAIACAHLGSDAALVTVVGRHALASVIRQELEKCSVQLIDLNPDFADAPVISAVTVDKAGNRNVVSANAMRVAAPPARVEPELCRQARIFMVDGHYMEACQAWAAAARASGTPVVLDGGSWKEGTEALLSSVHTAICSADFMPPGCSSRNEVIQFLKNCGVTNIAVTNGSAPIEFVFGQSSGSVRVPQVDAVDTMGAGDILHGAYCHFAAMGRDFVDSLTQAASIASESCRYAGTREWMTHFAA